ncbi:MAG TPA: glycosyltransferase family 39 protein [Bacteroidales bacterium]|nr:glycosyltransferase family 39 protein [Bacteroidales bacterium]
MLSVAITVGFLIVKIPYIKLPFYWDEAWVYGPAVRTMAHTGISFLPNALPTELYRGHPMLFHVLNGTWLKIFGNTITSAHFFNLLVACTLLLSIFSISKNLFKSGEIAFTCVIILSLQPTFLAQSTLVLPEVMVALFSLLTLYFFIQNNYVGYFIFASAASLTKETGIAAIATCLISYIISSYKIHNRSWKILVRNLVKLTLPTLPLLIFLFLQKEMHGWFLFPEHIGFISLSKEDIWQKLVTSYITFTFLLQGRNLLFFMMIFALLWLLYKKRKVENLNIYLIFLLFIIIYSLIGSINFFSKRYILSNIPIFILISVGIIFSTFRNRYFLFAFLILFSGLQIKYINFQNNSDHTLGFRNAVKVNQEMINLCLKKDIKDESIAVFFIQGRIMTDTLAGYVKHNEIFTNLNNQPENAKYVIVSNYDTNEKFLQSRNLPQMKLVARFEEKKAWIELYNNNLYH